MPDVLVTGIFGLVGVLVGAGTTGLIQYFVQQEAYKRQALEEEERQRRIDIEREATKAGEVLAAIHPWFDSVDAIVKLHIKRHQGYNERRPDISEKWYLHDKQFITALSSARVSAMNPAALQAFRDLSEARGIGVQIVNLPASDSFQGTAQEIDGALTSIREMKEQLRRMLEISANELEEAVLNWDGFTVRGPVSNFTPRQNSANDTLEEAAERDSSQDLNAPPCEDRSKVS